MNRRFCQKCPRLGFTEQVYSEIICAVLLCASMFTHAVRERQRNSEPKMRLWNLA